MISRGARIRAKTINRNQQNMKMNWAKLMSLIRNNPYAKKAQNVTRQAMADELGGAVLVEVLRALAYTAENPFSAAHEDEDAQKLLLDGQYEFANGLKREALVQKAMAAGLRNPWIPGDHFSLDEQVKIEERSKELADALKAQARALGYGVSSTQWKSTDDVLDLLFGSIDVPKHTED